MSADSHAALPSPTAQDRRDRLTIVVDMNDYYGDDMNDYSSDADMYNSDEDVDDYYYSDDDGLGGRDGVFERVPLHGRIGHDGASYANGWFGAVPASGEAIASLPKMTAASGERTEKQAEECAVCLEAFVPGAALRTMPCAHEFHDGCIVDWLRVSRACPLCRFELPAAAAAEAEGEDGEEEDPEEEPVPDAEDHQDDDAEMDEYNGYFYDDDLRLATQDDLQDCLTTFVNLNDCDDDSDEYSDNEGGIFQRLPLHERLPMTEHDGGGASSYANGGFGAVPASGEAVASLSEHAVCMDGSEPGAALGTTTMPCSHEFHEEDYSEEEDPDEHAEMDDDCSDYYDDDSSMIC